MTARRLAFRWVGASLTSCELKRIMLCEYKHIMPCDNKHIMLIICFYCIYTTSAVGFLRAKLRFAAAPAAVEPKLDPASLPLQERNNPGPARPRWESAAARLGAFPYDQAPPAQGPLFIQHTRVALGITPEFGSRPPEWWKLGRTCAPLRLRRVLAVSPGPRPGGTSLGKMSGGAQLAKASLVFRRLLDGSFLGAEVSEAEHPERWPHQGQCDRYGQHNDDDSKQHFHRR